MPFYKEIIIDGTQVLFWKYKEGDVFDEDFLLEEENKENIKKYHQKKKIENLMIRRMLKEVLPQHKILHKTDGEPYFAPNDKELSISHSFPFAVLAISEKKVGVDFERPQDKLKKIKHKFLFASEYPWVETYQELEFLSIIWTIKESLYKIHSSKYWSFKKHYEVYPFQLSDISKIRCRVFDEHRSEEFFAQVQKIEDYYFCIVQ